MSQILGLIDKSVLQYRSYRVVSVGLSLIGNGLGTRARNSLARDVVAPVVAIAI